MHHHLPAYNSYAVYGIRTISFLPFKAISGAKEIAQQVRAFDVKLEHLSSVFGIFTVKAEKQLVQVVFGHVHPS